MGRLVLRLAEGGDGGGAAVLPGRGEGSIRRRLEAEPAVRFALLFGSRARGEGRGGSDWDVAVYLDEAMGATERFRTRAKLAARLEDVASVDLVVLNDADALLGQRALQCQLLVPGSRRAYVRYFVRTMGLAEDQRYFDGILERARSRRLAEGTFGRP